MTMHGGGGGCQQRWKTIVKPSHSRSFVKTTTTTRPPMLVTGDYFIMYGGDVLGNFSKSTYTTQ